jgi:hypothetical protein
VEISKMDFNVNDIDYVACDEFCLHRKNGSKIRISWQIGTPYFSEGRWTCHSYLEGIDERPFKNYGVSSTQALLLSAAHGYSKIVRLIQNGNTISSVDDETERFSLQEFAQYCFPLCNPRQQAGDPKDPDRG